MSTRRIALVTCAELLDLDPDDRRVLRPLADRGVSAQAVAWDDTAVDWTGYDAVVLRSPWDYALRRDEFVRWARSVPRLANSAEVIAWNTDKRYLSRLAEAGVPVVATRWVHPGDSCRLPDHGDWVIKPAVGAGSVDIGRYDGANPTHRVLAAAHVARLAAAGRPLMVQPYLSAVDSYGETALLFLGGQYSHAIRKGPMLDGPDVGIEGLFKPENISPRTPTAADLAVAAQALAALPMPADQLLYARVDVIPDTSGAPLVLEVELTEPSLFLGFADGAAERFADAIVARL